MGSTKAQSISAAIHSLIVSDKSLGGENCGGLRGLPCHKQRWCKNSGWSLRKVSDEELNSLDKHFPRAISRSIPAADAVVTSDSTTVAVFDRAWRLAEKVEAFKKAEEAKEKRLQATREDKNHWQAAMKCYWDHRPCFDCPSYGSWRVDRDSTGAPIYRRPEKTSRKATWAPHFKT